MEQISLQTVHREVGPLQHGHLGAVVTGEHAGLPAVCAFLYSCFISLQIVSAMCHSSGWLVLSVIQGKSLSVNSVGQTHYYLSLVVLGTVGECYNKDLQIRGRTWNVVLVPSWQGGCGHLFEILGILDARLGMEAVYVPCHEQGRDPEALSVVIQQCHMAARALNAENMTG